MVPEQTIRQRLYFFDSYVAQLVLGVSAQAHKHGVLQLSVALDGVAHDCGPDPEHLTSALILDGLIAMFRDGHSITEAAVSAGFSDGAHFNRVMNQFMGVSPSVLRTVPIIFEFEFCMTEKAVG